MKKLIAVFCAAALCLALAACGGSGTTSATAAPTSTVVESAEMTEYALSEAEDITFSSDGVTATGSGTEVDGTVATITAPGAYRISGECENGQLWVHVDKTESVTLYLNGLMLKSADSCPLVVQHGLTTVVLMDGTENFLADAESYSLTVTSDDTAVDGALFAKDSLTIKGGGSLAVSGNYSHGIVCKDTLAIEDGTIDINCVQDGVQSNDGLLISGGDLTVSAGDDGMHCDSALEISGGTVNVLSSYEGIEGANITVSGGTINVKASDDGLNAAGGTDSSGIAGMFGGDAFAGDATKSILISGGTLFVDADGDGIDSNGSLEVTGGVTLVCGPTNSANGALDYGTGATVSGGVIMAAGATGMAESFDEDSTQGSIMANVSGEAGVTVALVDEGGTALCAFTPTKAYQNIVISCPGIESGKTYTIATGTVEGGDHGYAENAAVTDPVTLTTVEMTSLYYSEGGMGGGMGGGFGGDHGGDFGGKGQMPTDGTMPTMPADGTMQTPPTGGTMPEMPTDGTMPSPPGGMTRPDATSGATPSASPTPASGT